MIVIQVWLLYTLKMIMVKKKNLEDGAAVDQPFEFQPGVGLIQGWTDGVLQMNIGERAYLHVPSALGYGSNPMGSQGGAFYIPANSNLLFDIEILGIVGETEL